MRSSRPANRLYPQVDALGVVEPVDAEDDVVHVTEFGPDLLRSLDRTCGRRAIRSNSAVSIAIGAGWRWIDRVAAKPKIAPAERLGACEPLRAALAKLSALWRVWNAITSDAEQTLEDLAAPWQLSKELDGGKGMWR